MIPLRLRHGIESPASPAVSAARCGLDSARDDKLETASNFLSMEKRPFGKTDMQVTVLGFGAAEIGFEEADETTVERLLGSALDAGLNVIDTGECYRDSEEMIGKTVGHRRNEFYLFTKCGHPHGAESGANWSRDSILASIERSLQRLCTDRLDLVHLHSCSEAVLKKGEAIAALETAREKGYTRYIGYSGDSHAARYAAECGAFDSLQTSINIADQEALELSLPIAREKQMGVIAKRPIANAAWKRGHKPENSYHHTYWERLRTLNYPFIRQSDLEKSVAIALRFTLSVPDVCTAIVGTKNPARWEENARLLNAGPLGEAQFNEIRERWEEIAPKTWIGQT
jgi:aryl-alcohol dehydrogenase-like predicted oxidoreductase